MQSARAVLTGFLTMTDTTPPVNLDLLHVRILQTSVDGKLQKGT